MSWSQGPCYKEVPLYHIQERNYLWQFRCLEFRHLPRTLISRLQWAANFLIARSCRFGNHCVINVKQMVCAPVPINVVGCMLIQMASRIVYTSVLPAFFISFSGKSIFAKISEYEAHFCNILWKQNTNYSLKAKHKLLSESKTQIPKTEVWWHR